MAFKILYHEDALADLEEIFEWSREGHPETTEQFAQDLFDHIELLQAIPRIGTPIEKHPQPSVAHALVRAVFALMRTPLFGRGPAFTRV
jgi:plasmid stabilization system protein ParE